MMIRRHTAIQDYHHIANVFDILVSKLTPVVAKTGNVGSGMSPADELVLGINEAVSKHNKSRFGISLWY